MTLFEQILVHGPALLILVPLVAATLVPVIALRRAGLAHLLAITGSTAAAVLSWILLRQVVLDGPVHYRLGGWPTPFGIELVLDRLSAYFAAVVATVAAVTLAWAGAPVRRDVPGREGPFYSLALLLLTGLLGMVTTADIFNLYVFLEVASLAGYALVASSGGRGAVAAFRYLILGTVGASIYLLGAGYLYVATGTLNMGDLTARLADGELSAVAVACVVAGLAMKAGLFPLHAWLPDAYSDSPWAAATYIAPITTKVMIYGLVRFLFDIFAGAGDELTPARLGPILAWTGALAAIVGAAVASLQVRVRLLLAWSSISQIGFIVLGIGLAHPVALAGSLLHVLHHAVAKGALFAAGGVEGKERLTELRGLVARAPVTTACSFVAALALLGVPPLGGFFSKWYLIRGALAAGEPALAAVVVAASLVGAIYVFRLLEAVSFAGPARDGDGAAGTPEAAATGRPREALPQLVPLVLLTLGTLAIGLASPAIVRLLLWNPLP